MSLKNDTEEDKTPTTDNNNEFLANSAWNSDYSKLNTCSSPVSTTRASITQQGLPALSSWQDSSPTERTYAGFSSTLMDTRRHPRFASRFGAYANTRRSLRSDYQALGTRYYPSSSVPPRCRPPRPGVLFPFIANLRSRLPHSTSFNPHAVPKPRRGTLPPSPARSDRRSQLSSSPLFAARFHHTSLPSPQFTSPGPSNKDEGGRLSGVDSAQNYTPSLNAQTRVAVLRDSMSYMLRAEYKFPKDNPAPLYITSPSSLSIQKPSALVPLPAFSLEKRTGALHPVLSRLLMIASSLHLARRLDATKCKTCEVRGGVRRGVNQSEVVLGNGQGVEVLREELRTDMGCGAVERERKVDGMGRREKRVGRRIKDVMQRRGWEAIRRGGMGTGNYWKGEVEEDRKGREVTRGGGVEVQLLSRKGERDEVIMKPQSLSMTIWKNQGAKGELGWWRTARFEGRVREGNEEDRCLAEADGQHVASTATTALVRRKPRRRPYGVYPELTRKKPEGKEVERSRWNA
ncbi:hypothetical protein R3P38DRAFT_3356832 [Favolaschia claudopus]|uniref:Uncharacterized protein n=1 Tax=Favolaschia claudopus TaxID=2862362 RepID=A0AAW0BA20_9AGAR